MIWHIFKKDLKLLWPLVLIIAALHIMNASVLLILGHFGEPPELAQIAQFFPVAIVLGIAALIITTVHQDAVPGDRQDWLVRPIRRRDLIVEKLLFVLVAVHGPMLLVDLAQGLAAGFAFWDSLSAASSSGFFLLVTISLPALAIAAMTTTFVEVIGSVLAIFLIVVVFEILISALHGGQPDWFSIGMSWMRVTYWSAVALAASIAVIPLQYFRRATILARSIAFGAVLLIPVYEFGTWAPAFAFQQWFSVDPAAAKAVVVAFDPNLGKFAIAPGGQNPANSVWLPLRVSGLSPESIVINDRAYVRIIGRDGSILFSGRTRDPRVTGDPGIGNLHIDDFPMRTTTAGDVRTHELITLPGRLYELVRSQPVRMELDYSLTLFQIEASDSIAALNGDKRIAKLGWCKTKIDDDGDEVEMGCINTGNPPSCATAVLENTVSGQRNPPYNACRPDYIPYTMSSNLTALQIFNGSLHFRDPQGLAKYPVDSSQLANSRVSVKTYKPVAHFTRHLTIPEIRLGDWEAETHETATSTTTPPQ